MSESIAITSYPHMKEDGQKELLNNIKSMLPEEEKKRSEVLDVGAFDRMRQAMTQEGGFVVK